MKNSSKKVSIIIPAYNAARTIQRCIESLLRQTYEKYEIIVVDNGSTDNTAKIVKSYSEEKIKVYKEDNTGVGAARNTGIKNSTGEYIAFCDADDEYAPTFLDKMVHSAFENGVGIVKCKMKTAESNNAKYTDSLYGLGGKKIYTNHPEEKQLLYDLFFREGKQQIKCTTPTLLIRKKLLTENQICFDEKVCMMEDVLFYAKIFNLNEAIFFLDEELYLYHNNPNSATHSKSNIGNIIDGAILSCNKFGKLFGDDQRVNMKYLQVIFNYMYLAYVNQKELIIPESLSSIARKSKSTNSNRLWNIIASIIENGNVIALKIIFKTRHFKNKIKLGLFII